MPVLDSEMVYYLSGGASNTNVNNSLGGGISTTTLNADGSNTVRLQNLFSNRTAAQASAGGKWNRCIYLKNTNATLTASNITLWQSDIQPANDYLFIAIGQDGQGTTGTAVGPVANESTMPWTSTTARFHAYLSSSTPATVPNLAPGVYVAIWLQIKLLANSARYESDMFGIAINWT